MNKAAFDYAVQGLRLAVKTREAAQLVRVDGVSRPEAMEITGISPDTLSKALLRIEKNLQAQLAMGNLVFGEWIVPPELAAGLSAVEKLILAPRLRSKE